MRITFSVGLSRFSVEPRSLRQARSTKMDQMVPVQSRSVRQDVPLKMEERWLLRTAHSQGISAYWAVVPGSVSIVRRLRPLPTRRSPATRGLVHLRGFLIREHYVSTVLLSPKMLLRRPEAPC